MQLSWLFAKLKEEAAHVDVEKGLIQLKQVLQELPLLGLVQTTQQWNGGR